MGLYWVCVKQWGVPNMVLVSGQNLANKKHVSDCVRIFDSHQFHGWESCPGGRKVFTHVPRSFLDMAIFETFQNYISVLVLSPVSLHGKICEFLSFDMFGFMVKHSRDGPMWNLPNMFYKQGKMLFEQNYRRPKIMSCVSTIGPLFMLREFT